MAKSGALIISDVATEFFERTIWQDSVLDIFVRSGELSLPLSDYLIHVEGYDELGAVANGVYEVAKVTREVP